MVTTSRLDVWLKRILLLAATITLSSICFLCFHFYATIMPQALALSASLNESAASLAKASKSTQEYLDEQLASLRSPQQQAAIRAGIEAAGTVKATFKKINAVTLPKIHIALDSVNYDLQAIGRSVDSIDTMVVNLDREIAGPDGMLPATEESIKSIGFFAQTAREELKAVSTDIQSWTGSGEIEAILNDIQRSTANLEKSTSHAEKAMSEVPGIAQDVHKLTGSASKLSKAMSIGRLGVVFATLYSLIFN